MSLIPQQNNYTPDSPSSSSGSFSPGSFNPVKMVVSARGMLDTLTNKFILKPVNAAGIGGFVFDYEGETQLLIDSEISDHYTEQNAFINDQVAQKPQRITLRGFVGEHVDNSNAGVVGALNALQSKLTQLPAITGKYTPAVVQQIAAGVTSVTSTVNKIDDAIGRAQNAIGLFDSSAASPTRQQKAYKQLYTLWANNTVFTLVTPYNYFSSVMIERVIMVQPEETKDWSEFAVTVKEVRFLQTPPSTPGVSQQIASQNLSGRAAVQGQAQSNQGKVQGTQTAFSGLFSSFGRVQGPSVGSFG